MCTTGSNFSSAACDDSPEAASVHVASPSDLSAQLVALFPFFADMPTAAIEQILRRCPVRTAPAGSTLFTPEAGREFLPFILSGVMRISYVGPAGRTLPLYRVRAGEACPIITSCFLRRVKYSANALVEQDLTALAMPRDLFARLAVEQPAFATFVFKLFKEGVTSMLDVIDAVAFRRLDERLARLLLDLGTPARVTHQQLADELGSVREIVSRILHDFRARGWVGLRREQIDLLDTQALKALAAPRRHYAASGSTMESA